jgi:hypothetical protein
MPSSRFAEVLELRVRTLELFSASRVIALQAGTDPLQRGLRRRGGQEDRRIGFTSFDHRYLQRTRVFARADSAISLGSASRAFSSFGLSSIEISINLSTAARLEERIL